MPVFLAESIGPEGIQLSAEDIHHLRRVLRKKAGDKVDVVDGKGGLFHCMIRRADQTSFDLTILRETRNHLDPGYRLHLAVAPTKSIDRFEWFLEKATEIGITEISPMICTRSERRSIRHERQQRIIQAALKQSGRAILPTLHEAKDFPDLIRSVEGDRKYIAHCGAGSDQFFQPPYPSAISWVILIGPEGDFTEEELVWARARQFRDLNLGPATYRTETAAVMACHTLSLLYRSFL